MTRFSILGAMECWSGQRPVRISGTIQRTLLATLLASEGKPVSADTLVPELWSESPPPKWENALHAHISRLRRQLHTAGEAEPARLVTQSSGYSLLIGRYALDGSVFMYRVNRARTMTGTDPVGAVAELRAALSLWRGAAFELVVCGPLCRAAAHQYEAARLVGLELLFDLELQGGRHATIIPELTGLVESPMLNERFCEQLMVALYRSGRQTEALIAYRRMRKRMDDELGVEPTSAFRNHEKAILARHPALHVGADHLVLRAPAGSRAAVLRGQPRQVPHEA